MGIRETLNKNPSITTGVTIGIILVAIGAIVWQMMSGRPTVGNYKSYFTVDDGKSWFEDAATKNPPFDHNGQPAYRCFVFKCGENGTPFVAYMERFTPEVLKKLEAANPSQNDPMDVESGMELKKPGDPKWVVRSTLQGEKIANEIKCPDGSSTNIQPVSPGE